MTVHIAKSTELYTLHKRIVWHVNYRSIKVFLMKKKEEKEEEKT